MTESNMQSPLKSAKMDQLKHILPQAEKYLDAQLACGIAADQRGMAFAGFLAAAVIALVGGAGALLLNGLSVFLGYTALTVTIGLMVALALAVHSARPVGFEFAGNAPGQWADDIVEGKTEIMSLTEQAIHYDEMIHRNADVLSGNGKLLRWAQCITFGSLAIGAAGFWGYFLVR